MRQVTLQRVHGFAAMSCFYKTQSTKLECFRMHCSTDPLRPEQNTSEEGRTYPRLKCSSRFVLRSRPASSDSKRTASGREISQITHPAQNSPQPRPHIHPHQVEEEHQIQQPLNYPRRLLLRSKYPKVITHQQKHRRQRKRPCPAKHPQQPKARRNEKRR